MSIIFNLGKCRFCSNSAKLGQQKACVDCALIYDGLCADSAGHDCPECGGRLEAVGNVFPHNLFSAIKSGDLEAVEHLVSTYTGSLDDVKDRNGNPVLVVAVGSKADKGNLIAKRLVSLGASIIQTDKYGRTPLIRAAIGRHLNVTLAELLRDSVNCSDRGGSTALMFAAEGQNATNGRIGSMSTAKLLVKMGADVLVRSKRGETALGYAIHSNDTEKNDAMVEYLEGEMLHQMALALFKEQYRYEFNSKGVLEYSLK